MIDKLDGLDWKIIDELQKDWRKPFQEIARDLNVSGGTVQIRFNKMKKKGYIKEGCLALDPRRLGYEICAFIGVHLDDAREAGKVIEELLALPQVVEAHFTTGGYNLFLKVMEKGLLDLHRFLTESLEGIPGIRSTETMLSLNTVIEREILLH